MVTKVCSKCKRELAIKMFAKDKSKVDGYYSSCKLCKNLYYDNRYKEIKKENYFMNVEIEREKGRNHYHQNRKERLECTKKYNKEHKEEKLAYNRIYYKNYLCDNIKYRLSRAIRTKIVRTIKKGSKNRQRWEFLVGFTAEQLKKHLERMFKSGMSWSNYGKWHIDHIKPISAFDYNDYRDHTFKVCWSLNNLQPLWAKENMSKGGISV